MIDSIEKLPEYRLMNSTNLVTVNNKNVEDNYKSIFIQFEKELKEKEEQKVSFKEGASLFFNGFKQKCVDTVKSIVKHPLQTIGIVAGTTALLSLLPLIGVTAATGAAVLAVGFAGVALAKTGKDIYDAVKLNKEGKYNELREEIKDIGGDGVDLALSLPFMPKGLKQIKNQVKFSPKIGLNKELLGKIKGSDLKFGEKIAELRKADFEMSYEQITGAGGLKTNPKLQFYMGSKDISEGRFYTSHGIIGINEYHLNPFNVFKNKGNKNIFKKCCNFTKSLVNPSTNRTLVHELKHFKQYSSVMRHENIGIEGYKQRYSLDNEQFWRDVVDEQGIIKEGTKKAKFAEKVWKADKNVAENQDLFDNNDKFYGKDFMEKDAFAAEKKYGILRPGYKTNILQGMATFTYSENKNAAQ